MAKEKAPLPSPAPAADKKKALSTAMSQIEKMYGKGSIMRLGDRKVLDVEVVPTGRNPPVKPRWRSMWWRRRRSRGGRSLLWTQSMPWTPLMPACWA